jgi:hypothetical protein
MKKIFIVFNLLLTTAFTQAQNIGQIQKIIASDRTPSNHLGSAVAVNGNYLVVAASEIPSLGEPSSCNCVYVFEKNNGNWIQKQKLLPGDNTSGFGHAVAISRNYIIVGAPGDANNAGAVYIFIRNESGNWMQEKKLVANDREAGDLFGTSVSITPVYDRGDWSYVLIGAPGDADYGSRVVGAGTAYFFSNLLGTWEVINKLGAIGGTFFDRNEGAAFGHSVSISGTTAVIGAPGEKKDATGANPMDAAGAAYVFERNGSGALELVHKIVYWHRAAGDQFGYSVSISGKQMVIGAPFADEDAKQVNTIQSAGNAHVFFKQVDGTWMWGQVLVPNDRAAGDNFGSSVCISGDTIIAGAPTKKVIIGNVNYTQAGAAYLFKYSTDSLSSGWRPVNRIIADDHTDQDWFGYAVGIDGKNIIVGSPLQDKDVIGTAIAEAGALYVFGQKTCTATSSSISASVCKTYTSPSKKYTWTRTGTYKDTVLNKSGCDSVITINLTISNKADTSVTLKRNTLTANAKDANYQWIDCATNQPINITTRSLVATVNGSYKVIIDQEGCVGTSSCHNVVLINTQDSTTIVTKPPAVLQKFASVQKPFIEVNKIVANDRTHNDEFGRSVSISGNYAVIGVPNDDDDEKGGSVLGAGSAYIFHLDDGGKWKQLQKISAFDRTPGAAFGCAVGISGNYLVVGANRDNLGVNGLYDSYLAGSAYVYHLNNGTWQFMQKIIANPTARVQQGQAFFGTAVAIEGNTIAVAAPDHALDATDKLESSVSSAGAIFVYVLTNGGWIQSQKLVSTDRAIGDGLGNSVAICGDNIIAGSWGGDRDATYGNRMEAAGAAYIFERNPGPLVQTDSGQTVQIAGSWKLTQKIVANDRSPFDEFGFSVGISGNYAVVGARRVTFNKGDDAMDDYTGNAYIFKKGTDGKWVQQMKINPEDRTKGDYLGTAVAISGDYIIVSAFGQDTDSLGNYMPDAGAVYVYYNQKGDWIQSDKISPFYKHQLGHFGMAAAISDCTIIGTAWTDQTDENDENAISGTGAGFVFTAAGCKNNGRCTNDLFPFIKPILDKTKKDSTGSGKLPQKMQGPDFNAKGNEQKMDTINIKNNEMPQAININSSKTKNELLSSSQVFYKDIIKTDDLLSVTACNIFLRRRNVFELSNHSS